MVQASEQEGLVNNLAALKSCRKNRKQKKSKDKFEQDDAGNDVIPHQSPTMTGEEEQSNQGIRGCLGVSTLQWWACIGELPGPHAGAAAGDPSPDL